MSGRFFLGFVVLLWASLSHANVEDADINHVLAGVYDVEVSEFFLNDKVVFRFEVFDNGTIKIQDRNGTKARLVWLRSTTPDQGLLNGLPVVTVLLSRGSDEEAHDLHIRFGFSEGKDAKLQMHLLDALESVHEGPNASSAVYRRKVDVNKGKRTGRTTGNFRSVPLLGD